MMTKDLGTTAISTPGPRVESAPGTTITAPGTTAAAPAPGAIALALLSIGWLAAMLWSAQAEISSSGTDSIAIALAAFALPQVVSASLVSGAAVSLALVNLLARRGIGGGTPRFAAAVGAGLIIGLLAALAVALGYPEGPAIMVLAGTIAAAATIGGIAGGLRAPLLVAAVVTAGLAVFAVTFALGYFQDPLLSLFGAGETEASQIVAFRWLSYTASIASGLVAGLLAFGYLRVAQRRAVRQSPASAPLRWPVYLIAGAGSGLVLVTAEVLTRTAGGRVLGLASALSEADQTVQSVLGYSRVVHALLVLFIGTLTALIAFGRTLRPAE